MIYRREPEMLRDQRGFEEGQRLPVSGLAFVVFAGKLAGHPQAVEDGGQIARFDGI